MRETQRALASAGSDELAAIGARLGKGLDALDEAARYVLSRFATDARGVLAGAGPFLELAGIVCGGHELGRAALAAARKLDAGEGDAIFLRAKIATVRHFADHILTHAPGLGDTVVSGAVGALAVADEAL